MRSLSDLLDMLYFYNIIPSIAMERQPRSESGGETMTLNVRISGRIGCKVEEVFDAVVNPKKL